MSQDTKVLLERISELEHELDVQEAELHRHRHELIKASQTIERLIAKSTQDLDLLNLLQKYLSPTQIPHLPGFEFSSKFFPGHKYGGDYFDLFEHDDKFKFGILVSSASGYTLSSLLLSVIIKISGPMEAKRGLSPDKVIESLITGVRDQIPANSFASLFYAVIDRRTYEMTYCAIGSISAFVTLQSGALQKLMPCGEALQKDSQFNLVSQTVSLSAKDRLVLCTDGVSAVKNSSGASFSERNIEDCIRRNQKKGIHELRNDILFSAQKHSGVEDPERDQTVVIAEVKDSVIKLAKQK